MDVSFFLTVVTWQLLFLKHDTGFDVFLLLCVWKFCLHVFSFCVLNFSNFIKCNQVY